MKKKNKKNIKMKVSNQTVSAVSVGNNRTAGKLLKLLLYLHIEIS